MSSPKSPKLHKDYQHIEDIFMDSGAWSLFTLHILKKSKKSKDRPDYSYFDLTKGSEFRSYCDGYAAFIKKMSGRIGYYANVDVIGDAKRTWQVQKYFEKEHGLSPVPVIHNGEPMKWVDAYLEAGYKMIGLGGFATQKGGWRGMVRWCDEAFVRICPRSNNYMPAVKVHGFAVTGWQRVCRWPWYSVDSTSWHVYSRNACIVVPRYSETKGFRFDKPPMTINMISGTGMHKKRHQHIRNQTESVSESTRKWIEFVGVDRKLLEDNTDLIGTSARCRACLVYFEELAKSLPKWPWPLDIRIVKQDAVEYKRGFALG